MFTGIIKETGILKNIKDITDGKEIEVSCNKILEDIEIGDSICVNGVCLTVKRLSTNSFFSDLSFSTLSSTSFKKIKTGDPVNLEDSLRSGGKIGGHFVTGHIDSTAVLSEIEKHGDFYRLKLKSPDELVAFIAPKGSITIEGISLTVEKADDTSFSVVIIPYTFDNTNLKSKKQEDMVNLEVDLVARYISQLIKYMDLNKIIENTGDRDAILKEKLIKYGFYK